MKTLTIYGPRDCGWDKQSVVGQLWPTWSTVKHGTELLAWSGDTPFRRLEMDPATRTFVPRSTPFYPVPAGSMYASGKCYGWGPVRDEQPAGEVWDDGVDEQTSLCLDPAIFGLGAVLDGCVQREDRVLVLGLGAIGLFAVQAANSAGALTCSATASELRRSLSRADGNLVRGEDLFNQVRKKFTPTRVLVCSGSSQDVRLATKVCAQGGTVVIAGFVTKPLLDLDLEAFHNGLTVRFSLPALRWGNRTRNGWTYGQLRTEAGARLRDGRLSAKGMLTPVVPLAEAPGVFRLIEERWRETVKVGIKHT